MRLAPEISEAVGVAAARWAESTSSLPLIVRKTHDGAVMTQALPQARYSKADFAAELGMDPKTFRKKVEHHFGLEPATDGKYARETVEDVKRWLRAEEQARHVTPSMRRRAREGVTQ
jgi:hypothetical protein